jgi:hypothetical protein
LEYLSETLEERLALKNVEITITVGRYLKTGTHLWRGWRKKQMQEGWEEWKTQQ